MDQETIIPPEKSTRPLRIAIVCDMVPGGAGGSYISAMRFARLLKAKGHHVVIIGAKDSRQSRLTEYDGMPLYQYFAVPTPGSHRLFFQSFPRQSQLTKVFRDERIQIVHIMFPSYSCAVAKRAAKKLDLPLVAHIHTQPENIFNFLPSLLQTKFTYNLILRYLVRFVKDAREIICPSELGKTIYQKVDPTLPIHVISNGVDLAEFHAVDTSAFMEKYHLRPDDLHLIFVGRLMEEKGADDLANAMPEIVKGNPRAHALFVGVGPLPEVIAANARAAGIESHISLLGKISNEDLLAGYSASALFVLPSKVELEGMVVLEAMACGKPILIANEPMSASRYFVRENGLLCNPDDPKDLAQKALTILNDDALRTRMSANSLKDVQDFDIHRSADKLEAVYYSVIRQEAAAA